VVKIEKTDSDRTDVYIDKFATLITSAFALVAALAWNETIKALVVVIFPEEARKQTLAVMFVYAIFVTALAVLVTHNIGKFAEKAKKIT
jgi:hypothetical protein